MNKKFLLLILVIGCFIAIYNFKTPEQELKQIQVKTKTVAKNDIAMTVPVVSQTIPREPTSISAETSKYPKETLKKLSTLKEILTSKNDSDPRIDTELKNLSNADKDALVEFYQTMKPESLNDKGTIAFLIGREITRPEDAEFLKNILSEEPCLSLDNCGITNGERDPHFGAINDVTLNYPQIVALNRIKTYVQSHDLQKSNPSILNDLMDAVKTGQNSKIPMVQARSKEIANLLTSDLTKEQK